MINEYTLTLPPVQQTRTTSNIRRGGKYLRLYGLPAGLCRIRHPEDGQSGMKSPTISRT